MRFIATASVVCASTEIEPCDIAPVEKRLTISAAGSTSSIGTGFTRSRRNSNRPRKVIWRRDWSLMIAAYSLYAWGEFCRAECCSFAIASGVHMCSSPRTRQAYSPPASSIDCSTGSARTPGACAAKRSEEHTSELQSPCNLVCRLLLEKKKKNTTHTLH